MEKMFIYVEFPQILEGLNESFSRVAIIPEFHKPSIVINNNLDWYEYSESVPDIIGKYLNYMVLDVTASLKLIKQSGYNVFCAIELVNSNTGKKRLIKPIGFTRVDEDVYLNFKEEFKEKSKTVLTRIVVDPYIGREFVITDKDETIAHRSCDHGSYNQHSYVVSNSTIDQCTHLKSVELNPMVLKTDWFSEQRT